MTGNERLVVAGLFDQWADAIRRRDETRMVEILLAVEYTADDARSAASSVLADPKKYGY